MQKFVAVLLLVTGVTFAFFWTAISSSEYKPRLTIGIDVCDYRVFIKKCLIEEQPYRPVTIPSHDACYPPIAYSLVKFFPLTSSGEALYVASLFIGLISGLIFFMHQRKQRDVLLCVGAVVLTIPFASGPLRGNPSAWAAGALFVYLAWFDSVVMWKRMVAAVALGFATALKITPVIYGLLYLRGQLFKPEKWPKEEIFCSLMSFVFFFAIPFTIFGGANEVDAWLSNALGNTKHYSPVADFGLTPIVRAFRHCLPFVALTLAVHLTTLLAFVFCFAACYARRYYHALTLLGVAMVFLCHHDYGLAYLLPAFGIWMSETRTTAIPFWLSGIVLFVEAFLWFLIFEQVVCLHSYWALMFNEQILCNIAVILLGLLSCTHVLASLMFKPSSRSCSRSPDMGHGQIRNG